jgi:DNA-binding response OmpR family regulator
MPERILVVDDEPSVTDMLAYNLRKAHFEVFVAADGRQALELARDCRPDLIVLDLMLPGIDGLDVCRALREESQVPIIMLTARGEEIDRVLGLELGADDYVCKPFSVRELMARIRAVLRRVPAETAPVDSGCLTGPGGLRLDEARRELTIAGVEVELSRLEFDLLCTLLTHAGRVLSREQLLDQVWGYDYPGDVRAVDSAVKRLRARLRAVNPDADGISAVRGVGYKFRTDEAP